MDSVVVVLAFLGALFGVIGIFRNPAKTDWWAEYNRYLKSPEWQQKRQAVIRRAEGRCELCGMRKPIQVHHLTYARMRHELPEDLAALCFDCHKRQHSGKGLYGHRN